MNTTLLAFVVLYLLGTLALGVWAGSRVKTTADFAIAGRSLPLVMVITTTFATWFGAETVMGIPAKFVQGGIAQASMVGAGTIISGGTVRNSVLSSNIIVEDGATVEGSVIFPGVRIGRGAVVRHAILDKNVVVPDGATVGVDHERDAERFKISPGGVISVGKGEVV